MKLSKKYFIFFLIAIFLLGGFFHRELFFPFNEKLIHFYQNKFKVNNMVDKVKNKSRSIYEYKLIKNIKLFSLYKDDVKIDFEKKTININMRKK